MITGAQITAGRALLGWSMRDLARHAGMDIAHVQEAETSVKIPKRRRRDLPAIQQALQDAGIEFIDSVGVQLLPRELMGEIRRSSRIPEFLFRAEPAD
jgi:transcriptional regulator with XRE-family HTH domain